MLITEFVYITITNSSIYKELGNIGEKIRVSVHSLLPNSIKKVVAKCDNCGCEKHKISIKYGYDNDIAAEIIADVTNLCSTKRINNLKKSSNIC